MIRHLSFRDRGELIALLVREGPAGVYASNAYYYDPTLPMEQKGWRGADLIFDIDAEDLGLPCRQEHDWWECRECGQRESGLRPERCPACGSGRLEQHPWVCDRCLEGAKREVVKLLEFLIEDLGLDEREISVHFSGNMGYHISVASRVVEALDQQARAELADYVSGTGIMPEAVGYYPQATFEALLARLPRPTDPGWRGRVAEHLWREMEAEGVEDPRVALSRLYVKHGYRWIKRRLEALAAQLGARIDKAVTVDVHRIFRLPGTLHEKTGLVKKRVRDLEGFDPLREAVAFEDGSVELKVSFAPAFRLGDERFGPYREEQVKLPYMAAAYLLGRGLARVV